MPSQNRTWIRVLVVDGGRRIADLLAGILHMSGYDARVLYDIADVIWIASEFRPHVLITDVKISRMDGFELAAELAQRFPCSSRFRTTCNVYLAVRLRNPSPFRIVRFAHMNEFFQFIDDCVPSMELPAEW